MTGRHKDLAALLRPGAAEADQPAAGGDQAPGQSGRSGRQRGLVANLGEPKLVKLSVPLPEDDRRALELWAQGHRAHAGRRALPSTDVIRALIRELVSDPNGKLAAAVIDRLRR